jgi:hypothetical protein
LPANPFLEIVALGYRPAAADAAWLQAVHYYGEYRQGGNDLSEFQHYVAAVNALDPRFIHPYIFGAVVLASEKHDLPAAMESCAAVPAPIPTRRCACSRWVF